MNSKRMLPMKILQILSLGAGVDSTCLLVMHFNREKATAKLGMSVEKFNEMLPHFDAVAFSDPGSEWPQTYENVKRCEVICKENGLEMVTVRRGEIPGTGAKEDILEWLRKNGTVPLLPGGQHVCSMRFKGEVLQKWADNRFGKEVEKNWSIGITSDENYRTARFQGAADSRHIFRYPLQELDMTREDGIEMLEHLGWPIPHKSSCVWCPFLSLPEIVDMVHNGGEQLEHAKEIERKFAENSPIKYQRWVDEGMPLRGRCTTCTNCKASNKKKDPCKCGDYNRCYIKIMEHDHTIQNEYGWELTDVVHDHTYSGIRRAPPGMWKYNYWYDDTHDGGAARLLSKTVEGTRLAIEEWEEAIKADTIYTDSKGHLKMRSSQQDTLY